MGPSCTLRRAPRLLLGVFQGLFYILVPQERLTEPLPDSIFDGRLVRMLRWDQGRFSRLLEQYPPPFGERTRFGLGASVPSRASNACDAREVRKRSSSTAAGRSWTVLGIAKVCEPE